MPAVLLALVSVGVLGYLGTRPAAPDAAAPPAPAPAPAPSGSGGLGSPTSLAGLVVLQDKVGSTVGKLTGSDTIGDIVKGTALSGAAGVVATVGALSLVDKGLTFVATKLAGPKVGGVVSQLDPLKQGTVANTVVRIGGKVTGGVAKAVKGIF